MVNVGNFALGPLGFGSLGTLALLLALTALGLLVPRPATFALSCDAPIKIPLLGGF